MYDTTRTNHFHTKTKITQKEFKIRELLPWHWMVNSPLKKA